MALVTQYRTTTATGVLAAFLLVLVFGSPPYGSWARDNADTSTAGGWFLGLLSWPTWQVDAEAPGRDTVAFVVRAVLVVVFTAVLLTVLSGPRLSRARGTAGQLLTGWAAYIFAAAAAGLFTALIGSEPTLLGAFRAASAGATYALFTGWIVGLATFGAPRRMT